MFSLSQELGLVRDVWLSAILARGESGLAQTLSVNLQKFLILVYLCNGLELDVNMPY